MSGRTETNDARDEFARHAPPAPQWWMESHVEQSGPAANPGAPWWEQRDTATPESILAAMTLWAYAWADAMLKARGIQ